jgi:hypothetical protein
MSLPASVETPQPFVQTVFPLVLASLVPAVMGVGFMAIRDGALIGGLPFVFVFAWVWGFSLAASALFVLPLFALAPRLRVPPLWLTTVWGALVAFVWMRLLAGLMGFPNLSRGGWAQLVISGGTAGATYAFLIRRVVGPDSRSRTSCSAATGPNTTS